MNVNVKNRFLVKMGKNVKIGKNVKNRFLVFFSSDPQIRHFVGINFLLV